MTPWINLAAHQGPGVWGKPNDARRRPGRRALACCESSYSTRLPTRELLPKHPTGNFAPQFAVPITERRDFNRLVQQKALLLLVARLHQRPGLHPEPAQWPVQPAPGAIRPA